MKKLFISALASVVAFGGLTAAAEESININNIYVSDGTVYVEAENNLQVKNVFTLRMLKNDEGLNMRQKLYSVLQKEVEPGGTIVFDIPIPDERLSVRGSGEYTVSVQAESGARDEEVFNYEDSVGIVEFIDEIKEASKSVADEEKAWEILEPLFESDKCKGAMFSLGISYDSYIACDSDIKHQVLNEIFLNIDKELTAEKFAEVFTNSMSLGIYNSGEKESAIEALNPKYNGEKINDKYIEDTIDRMDNTYATADDLEEGFKISYGLVSVCKAKVDELKDCLNVFAKETGECESIIDKIEKLSSVKRYVAYEYIAKVSDSKIDSVESFEEVLEEAYDEAVENNKGSGGSGGGGGASGSVANKKPVSGSSVSSATGSKTPDVKVEDTIEYIFTDFIDEHWAAEAVSALKEKGIISGTDTGAFEPDRPVLREEFTKMLVAACELETDEHTVDFADTKDGEWYIPYIGVATDKGIVMGIGDNLFGVGAKITRQDMAVMADRAIALCGYETSKVRNYSSFDDESEFGDYAKDSIVKLFENGVINGKGNNLFEPLGNATRAEAAKIIYEAFKGGI